MAAAVFACALTSLGGELRAQEADAAEEAAALTPPSLLEPATPLYPDDAREEGVAGAVVVRIDIDTQGDVSYVSLVEAPDPRLGWSALGAATRLRFSPARMGETPVPVRVDYTFHFVIEERTTERALEVEEARELFEDEETAPINFKGRLLVAAERRSVAGATLWIEGTDLEAWADEDGEFSFRGVPEGERAVHVEIAGFESFVVDETFAANEVTEVTYYLRRVPGSEYETVVRDRKARREVTKRTLTQQELTRVPGTFGDAIRVVQRLPGVARAPFGLGAIVIRGGAPDDSAINIDGHLTRLLFHLGAGPSIVNSDVVEKLELYPGGFGVRFGRSHAGVVDVVTRDPNRETWSGAVKVDLLQTNFRLEGPMLGGAVFFAARRSYVAEVLNIGDVVSRFVDLKGTTFTLAPRYQDYQAKAAWRLGRGWSLSLNLIGTDDELDFAVDASELGPTVPERTGIKTGFHRFYPRLRYASIAEHDDGRPIFRAEISPMVENSYSENRFDESLFAIEVLRGGLRAEAEIRPFPFWGIVVGTDDAFSQWSFSTDVPFILPDERLFPRPATSDPVRYQYADETYGQGLAFYAESDLELGPLLLVGGLRTDLWSWSDQVRSTLDPRLTARWDVLAGMTFKGNVGRYHKLPSPFEISDDFGNPNLPIEEGWQYGFGVEAWLTRSLNLDWQLFYRTLLKLPAPVRSPLSFEPSDDPFIQPVGEGRVWGTELLVRQHLDGGLFGWVAYTLLRSERRFLDESPPRWRVAQVDQTHIVSVALSYRLPWDFELGGALRYVTGNPQTFAVGGFLDTDTSRYRRFNGPPLAQRLPGFFQVDLRVDKRFVFDTWALSLFLDLQNATNQQNFEFFTYNYDYSEIQGFPGLPILPVIGAEASF
jgi:TonB family protein